ncbi:MAG: tRNA (adenosine(37)-N6)-threonylcarbamoyltransferase complex ATPase subunit type 1 TsaE [Albidovulum sp.]
MNDVLMDFDRSFTLLTDDATAGLARRIAPVLAAGDVILLKGPIGAGKTHFARSLIQARLAELGRAEDVPSPTFTLVQVYEAGPVEIWHADLYRLTQADEVVELGLADAFEAGICLVEWPERLGRYAPANALTLSLAPDSSGTARRAHLCASDQRWAGLFTVLDGAGYLDE